MKALYFISCISLNPQPHSVQGMSCLGTLWNEMQLRTTEAPEASFEFHGLARISINYGEIE